MKRWDGRVGNAEQCGAKPPQILKKRCGGTGIFVGLLTGSFRAECGKRGATKVKAWREHCELRSGDLDCTFGESIANIRLSGLSS